MSNKAEPWSGIGGGSESRREEHEQHSDSWFGAGAK